jgi:hypothetical protein
MDNFGRMCKAHEVWVPIKTGLNVPEWLNGTKKDGKPFLCNEHSLCTCYGNARANKAYAVLMEYNGNETKWAAAYGVRLMCRAGYEAWLKLSLEVKTEIVK